MPGTHALLERDAPRLEVGDFRFHVRDLPEGLARLRGPRIGGRVEKGRRTAAFVDHAAGVLLFWREADDLFIELPGAGHVPARRYTSIVASCSIDGLQRSIPNH